MSKWQVNAAGTKALQGIAGKLIKRADVATCCPACTFVRAKVCRTGMVNDGDANVWVELGELPVDPDTGIIGGQYELQQHETEDNRMRCLYFFLPAPGDPWVNGIHSEFSDTAPPEGQLYSIEKGELRNGECDPCCRKCLNCGGDGYNSRPCRYRATASGWTAPTGDVTEHCYINTCLGNSIGFFKYVSGSIDAAFNLVLAAHSGANPQDCEWISPVMPTSLRIKSCSSNTCEDCDDNDVTSHMVAQIDRVGDEFWHFRVAAFKLGGGIAVTVFDAILHRIFSGEAMSFCCDFNGSFSGSRRLPGHDTQCHPDVRGSGTVNIEAQDYFEGCEGEEFSSSDYPLTSSSEPDGSSEPGTSSEPSSTSDMSSSSEPTSSGGSSSGGSSSGEGSSGEGSSGSSSSSSEPPGEGDYLEAKRCSDNSLSGKFYEWLGVTDGQVWKQPDGECLFADLSLERSETAAGMVDMSNPQASCTACRGCQVCAECCFASDARFEATLPTISLDDPDPVGTAMIAAYNAIKSSFSRVLGNGNTSVNVTSAPFSHEGRTFRVVVSLGNACGEGWFGSAGLEEYDALLEQWVPPASPYHPEETFWSFQFGAGDCCGGTFAVIPGGPNVEVSGDVGLTVTGNNCCKEPEGGCEKEAGDCDGSCNPFP